MGGRPKSEATKGKFAYAGGSGMRLGSLRDRPILRDLGERYRRRLNDQMQNSARQLVHQRTKVVNIGPMVDVTIHCALRISAEADADVFEQYPLHLPLI